MPRDTVVLSGMVGIPRADIDEDTSIEIGFRKADAVPVANLSKPKSSDFEVSNVSVVNSDWSSKVTGEVKNNFSEEQDMLALHAVFKNGDEIVYCESTYVNDIPSGSSVPFEISVMSDLPQYTDVQVYAQSWM